MKRAFEAVLILLIATFSGAAETPPERSGRVDEERVERLQLDVSVIDPEGDGWASVPELPRDAFKVRMNGRPLEPGLAKRVEFDEICGRPAPGAMRLPGELPTLIVLVDLNYLDGTMRSGVQDALHRLSERMDDTEMRVKVLAFSRRLVSLTDGFSGDPAAIRRAGALLTDMPADGPPPRPMRGLPSSVWAGSEELMTRNEHIDGFTGDEIPGPDTGSPAISIKDADVLDPLRIRQELRTGTGQVWSLSRTRTDPRPSIAALEAVLETHASLRGRKALLLFSSGWFDLDETLWLSYTTEISRAAQHGYTIWTVDSRGLSGARHRDDASRLLTYLASSSGGASIDNAGRLGVAFDRALAQLSCYYLFSVPIEIPTRGRRRLTLGIDLDTEKYPELWRHRVRHRGLIAIENQTRRREHRRLAALMDPDAHSFPRVRIHAAYPAGSAKKMRTPVEVSVLLPDLHFRPSAKGFSSRIGWEGLVTDAVGNTVCRLGDGRARSIRSPAPPRARPPSSLVLSEECRLPRPGHYEARVVVEDFETGEIGAARADLTIADPRGTVPAISAARLGRNTGRDFLVELDGKERKEAGRDDARRAFVPVAAGGAIVPEDRLLLRFVTCEDQAPRVVLYRRNQERRNAIYQLLLTPRGTLAAGEARCREFEAAVIEHSLEPGDYGVAILPHTVPARTREELDGILAEPGYGTSLDFRVQRPGAPLPPRGGRGSPT